MEKITHAVEISAYLIVLGLFVMWKYGKESRHEHNGWDYLGIALVLPSLLTIVGGGVVKALIYILEL